MTAVAVAGMHRTGTSMVAKALRLAGLYLGEDEDLVEAAPDNPEGFYEHAGIVTCNDDLLEVTGGAWDHPPPCPPLAADDSRVVEVADRARKTIALLAVTDAWGWKDPRTSLTARFWLDLVPDLRVVVCVRHPLEVALSLKRRNRSSYAHGLALWHSYYDALLDTVPEDRRIVTHYDAHLNNGDGELERLLRFAHLNPSAASTALSAANPHLRHHRIDVSLVEAGVAPPTIDLYRRLCEEAGHPFDHPKTDRAPARLDRTRLDLALAEEHLEQRQRQIDSLREERTRLESRLTRVEETVDRLGALAQLEGRLETRFEALTAAVTDVTYRVTGLHDREQDPVVRGCRELIGRHTGRGDAVLVIAKGDPALLDLSGRATLNFPHHASRRYPGYAPPTATSAIGHLEALRLRGVRFLLVPDTARWWLDHYALFAAHVTDRYRVIADEPAGLVVDLTARADTDGPSSEPLTRTIERISAAAGPPPAVLDWTGQGLGRHLPDHNVFVPPNDGLVLPYLERSIDVVMIADDQRTSEARRVASQAVVRIDDLNGVPRIAELMTLDGGDGAGAVEAPLTVVVDPGGDDRWLSHVGDLIDRETNVSLRAASRSVALKDGIAGYAVLLEPGVLPLPGWANTVRTTLAAHPDAGALAVCLLDASGGLEAAGAVVFDDASWAGVGHGSPHVSAPWHNYVRPTCAAPGMAVVRGDLAAATGGDRSPLAWAATLWEAGQRVLYQPEVWAVRAQGAAPAPPLDELAAEAWAPVLPSRPARPEPLDDRAWRELVACDDVEECWGLR